MTPRRTAHRSPKEMAIFLQSKLTVAEFGELADLLDESEFGMFYAITDIDVAQRPEVYGQLPGMSNEIKK